MTGGSKQSDDGDGGGGTGVRRSKTWSTGCSMTLTFTEEKETCGAERGANDPRGAGGFGRRGMSTGPLSAARRCVDTAEGGDESGAVGLRRVEAGGEAAVQRSGTRCGLQPGHGQGLRAGATRRRDAGGRGGPGDAVAARQGRLGTQPAGAPAPERRCVMVTANATVDIPALKTRHPLG